MVASRWKAVGLLALAASTLFGVAACVEGADAQRLLPALAVKLQVAVVGAGSVDPSIGTYEVGELVELTATPDAGWRFDHWEGDLTGSENPFTITMNADVALTAVLVRQFALEVSVAGDGSVQVAGADALAQYVGDFDEDEEVTLLAMPAEGWTFLRWEGDVRRSDEESNPLIIKMDDDLSITAVFVRQYIVAIAIEGAGTVDPEGGPFADGTQLTLTATPAENCAFAKWEGDVPVGHETDNPLTLVVDGDKALTAVFRSPPKDGEWIGSTSQGETISFRVSDGGTTISGVKIYYDLFTTYCWLTGSSELLNSAVIDTTGSFSISAGSFLATYVRVSGDFLSDKRAEGTAHVSYYSYSCGSGSTSPTWTASWSSE